MKESWERAVNITLDLEGREKYTNDPDDPGGPTKYGIAGNFHPGVDIKNLTLEQAKEIYRKEYWLPAGCDEAPYPLDICLFDSQVNPQNDPRLPGGGNKEILNQMKDKTNWLEYQLRRMIRYMECSKRIYVTGHIFRVLKLTKQLMKEAA